MQMLLDMWNASPGGVILFSIPILIFAGFVIGFVLSTAVDVLQMLINGVVRVFRGHPPVASQAYPIAVDDDEDEDHPGIGMTDRQMQCLADRLVGEIVPKALIEVSRHADLLDRLALKIADRQNELNADATADDALVAKIADAVRDRVNEVTVSATDLDLFAAKVMELADKRRAEREAAKAEQAEFAAKAEAEPAETPEPPKFGIGDRVRARYQQDLEGEIKSRHQEFVDGFW